jgi:hypothetical protein
MNMSHIFFVVGISIKRNWLNYGIGNRTWGLNTASVKSFYWTWSSVSFNHLPVSQSFSWRSTLIFHPSSWSLKWLLFKRFLYQNSLCSTWLSIWTASLAHHSLPSFTIITLLCDLCKSQSFFLYNILIVHLIPLRSKYSLELFVLKCLVCMFYP